MCNVMHTSVPKKKEVMGVISVVLVQRISHYNDKLVTTSNRFS